MAEENDPCSTQRPEDPCTADNTKKMRSTDRSLSPFSCPQLALRAASDASKATIERNERNSPLLLLPGEIRNSIYEYVLYEGTYEFTYIQSSSPPNDEHDIEERVDVHLAQACPNRFALLHVSRELYIETALLPYSLNTFSFGSFRMFSFFSHLTLEQRSAVKTVELKTSWGEKWRRGDEIIAPSHLKLKLLLPNLRSVRVVNNNNLFNGALHMGTRTTLQGSVDRMRAWLREALPEGVVVEFKEAKGWGTDFHIC